MNVLYKGARLIKDMYNQLNPATLTGAIDILVIEQEDGTLTSSPFHVRFGKLGVMRAKEKVVNIMINEESVGLHMKLGDQGEAFFVVETEDEEIPPGLLTSPMPSRPSSPFPTESEKFTNLTDDTTVKKKRKKRRKRRSLTSSSNVSDLPNDLTTDSEEEANSQPTSVNSSNVVEDNAMQSQKVETVIQITEESSTTDQTGYICNVCNVYSDSELDQERLKICSVESHFSDSEVGNHERPPTNVGWDWGELPNDVDTKIKSLDSQKNKLPKISVQNEHKTPEKQEILKEECNSECNTIMKQSESNDAESPPPSLPQTPKQKSPSKSSSKSLSRPSQGLYLDEILDLEPMEANLYFSSKTEEVMELPEENDIDNARSRTPEHGVTGSDAGVDSGTDCMISDDNVYVPTEMHFSPIKMSLCGARYEQGKISVDKKKFEEKLVTYEQFVQDPVGITNNTELIVLLGELYCDWVTAGPMLLSLAMFKKPLAQETVERVVDMQLGKKSRAATGGRLSWFWRRSSTRESNSNIPAETGSSSVKHKDANDTTGNSKTLRTQSLTTPTASPSKNGKRDMDDNSSSCEDELSSFPQNRNLRRAQTVQCLQSSTPIAKAMKKTTRLTSDQLKSLNLKPGANEVEFSVTSQYQGTSRCFATVYFWRFDDQIVVSDIDGTITKSDVFGQILPVVGKDWTQGGVAQLYHNISKNGYKFIYLSSRAIGQAGMTKGYLNWINQQGVSLPAGPLFLSPTSLMRAFKAEVIEKTPEKFKIACLKDITSLFPAHKHPLVAGFGNKINDVCAYATAGVPKNRIFTINHRGELRQEDLQTYKTSYQELGDIVDIFFPAMDSKSCQLFSDTSDYSAFNFWQTDFVDIEGLPN